MTIFDLFTNILPQNIQENTHVGWAVGQVGHLGANNGADQYGRMPNTATTRPDLDSLPDSPSPKIGHINCKPLTAPAGSSIPPNSGAKMKRDAAWVRHLESTENYTKDEKSKQVQIDSRTI